MIGFPTFWSLPNVSLLGNRNRVLRREASTATLASHQSALLVSCIPPISTHRGKKLSPHSPLSSLPPEDLLESLISAVEESLIAAFLRFFRPVWKILQISLWYCAVQLLSSDGRKPEVACLRRRRHPNWCYHWGWSLTVSSANSRGCTLKRLMATKGSSGTPPPYP